MKIITAIVTSLFLSGSAFAADLYLPAPNQVILPGASVVDWTGFYAGVSAGYGRAGIYLDAVPDDGADLSGIIGGVQVGYNHQAGNIVFGVEGDVLASNINVDAGAANNDFGTAMRVNYLASLRARLGISPASNFLIYATGGIAAASVTVDTLPAFTENHVGFAVGAGAEALITDKVSVKAEYVYYGLGSQIYDFGVDSIGLTAHTAKVGINFHF